MNMITEKLQQRLVKVYEEHRGREKHDHDSGDLFIDAIREEQRVASFMLTLWESHSKVAKQTLQSYLSS